MNFYLFCHHEMIKVRNLLVDKSSTALNFSRDKTGDTTGYDMGEFMYLQSFNDYAGYDMGEVYGYLVVLLL